jgi:hypothetical protein
MRVTRYILILGFLLLIRVRANSESYFLGIENKNGPSVELYPNPATNAQVTISAEKEIQKIQLLNIVGEQVRVEEPESSNTVKLALEDIKNGIYIVKITFTDNTSTTKRLWVK